jgi:uncharacterized protein Usg
MKFDSDFSQMLNGYVTVSVNVIYHMPDHKSLLNEFIWTTLDLKPKYPRVKRFLDFWEAEIEGKINKVIICDGKPFEISEWRNGILIPFLSDGLY